MVLQKMKGDILMNFDDIKDTALLAAQHKKHIHMEKPGGIEPILFERLIETVKQQKTAYFVSTMSR